jgi:hypothetical protein
MTNIQELREKVILDLGIPFNLDTVQLVNSAIEETFSAAGKVIDEIPDITDDVGGGLCDEEMRKMFRTGYVNGRIVLKKQLKSKLQIPKEKKND